MFFYNDISRHPHQVFAPCLRKICSLVRAQKFPPWEQIIPSMGTTINIMISHDIQSVKLLPSSLDKPQALCTKASRDGRSHFNTSLSPPFFRKQSPAAGGLTGGQWEVLAKHLPSHFPFIYRPFTPLTGGREVFYKMSFSRHPYIIRDICKPSLIASWLPT